jgi:FlaA1/EpsC-like NDP-sugar epimerase
VSAVTKEPDRVANATLRALVVGAGEAGVALARDLRRVCSFGLTPVGFLDDDVTKLGTFPEDIPVLGVLDELERIIEDTQADAVVIAIPSIAREIAQELGMRAAAQGLTVMHLPPFISALQRQIAGTDLRSLHIGALIGRSQVHVVSAEALRFLAGKRVLITGAGGSIGAELCRQVRACAPESLVMLDHDESNLHTVQLDVWGEAALDGDAIVVADIRDEERIHQVFRDHRPQIVFHAAALKHLNVLERHPCEGVKSNVRGTQNLAEAAVAYGTERFVLISTDKAADPTSVLGATKRLAELLLDDFQHEVTQMCSVRFGNVLGSRGSLLHVVREQLASGMPVTVTDPDVTRFFMTIEEAVGLVIEAAHMPAASGSTYVLDMGAPVRIVDLVRSFAETLNVRDVRFRFTGLRPGEKLAEDLFGDAELRTPTPHPRITMSRHPDRTQSFRAHLRELYDAAGHNRPAEVINQLCALVPEYTPPAVTVHRDEPVPIA